MCRQDFANLAEAIVKGSDRRTDLNKAYSKLVRVLFEQIQRVAGEHQKTPREVVLMGKSCVFFVVPNRPDVTFAVDWALKNDYRSIYRCPSEVFPWKMRVSFPEESQLQESYAYIFIPTVVGIAYPRWEAGGF